MGCCIARPYVDGMQRKSKRRESKEVFGVAQVFSRTAQMSCYTFKLRRKKKGCHILAMQSVVSNTRFRPEPRKTNSDKRRNAELRPWSGNQPRASHDTRPRVHGTAHTRVNGRHRDRDCSDMLCGSVPRLIQAPASVEGHRWVRSQVEPRTYSALSPNAGTTAALE